MAILTFGIDSLNYGFTGGVSEVRGQNYVLVERDVDIHIE